jgi:hypothetical protein
MVVSSQDGDVIFLRASPKRRQPAGAPSGGKVHPSNAGGRGKQSYRHSATRSAQHSRRTPNTKPKAPRAKSILSKKPSAPRKTTVPATIRDKFVKLGRPRKPNGQPHLIVYGFFDAVGRFCRRVGADELQSNGRPKHLDFSSINHKDIEYHPCFQGVAGAKIQDKFCQVLKSHHGIFFGSRCDIIRGRVDRNLTLGRDV